jgi:hypothetical protein
MHEPVYNIQSQGTEWIDVWLARSQGHFAAAFIGSELCVFREDIDAHMRNADVLAHHHVCLLRSPAEVHKSLASNTPLGDCPEEFTNRIHSLIQRYHYDLHLTYPIGKEDVLKIMRLVGVEDYTWRLFMLSQMERMHVQLTETHLKRICDDARNEH